MRPEKKPNLTPIDERNIARLGIVSIQSRLESENRWGSEFRVGERRFRIEGRSADGRPRGIDTNVLIGVETLFAAREMPEDNWLHTTAYELREAGFLANNGKSYHRLRESLLRLWSTGFIVGEGWLSPDGKRITWANQTLRLIERITYWDQSEGADPETDRARQLVPEATLSIKLGDQLAQSIRAGYTQALDERILLQIEQPPARALYRLLEAHRYDDAGLRVPKLNVTLEDWRVACGIVADKPSRVLRALSEAHEELQAQGYIRDVQIEGGRGQQRLTYVFVHEDDPDPALLQLLRNAGVSAPRANTLARAHPERVEDALSFLEYRRRHSPGSVRNPGGFVADVLEHPEKYVLPEELIAPSRQEENRRRAEEQRRDAEVREEALTHAQQDALLLLPPGAQWQAALPVLRTVLSRYLVADEWRQLERECLGGQLQAAELSREASRALAGRSLKPWVETLRSLLRSLS